MTSSLRQLYETVRYFQWTQWQYQLLRRLPRPKTRPGLRLPVRGRPAGPWQPPVRRPSSLVGPSTLRCLGTEFELADMEAWNHSSLPSLARYNLHYFDCLLAADALDHQDWLLTLVQRWIDENSLFQGIGWDPYPTSLRIVNWIKWRLNERPLSERAIESLAQQARHLRRSVEWHLMGNHLLANAKALVFAGLFLRGREADSWYRTGLSILSGQIAEQVLDDGGHFERSPMYHSIILEDLLDLLNLLRAFQREADFAWHRQLESMQSWLRTMCHPDGQIALLNDAAFQIAASPSQLGDYAQRLGLALEDGTPRDGITHLASSGYLRYQHGPVTAVLDIAPVGPDYIPGHAHADTLTFELSHERQRVLVDSGTSLYEIGTERLRQRGTAAHNTLRIDRHDSSEVWSSFRVARRARVIVRQVSASLVVAEHDGYQRLPHVGPTRRQWRFHDQGLELIDHVAGAHEHLVESFLHFHPDVLVSAISDHQFSIQLPNSSVMMTLIVDPRVAVRIESSYFCPEFGVQIPNQCVVLEVTGLLPLTFKTSILWLTHCDGAKNDQAGGSPETSIPLTSPATDY